MLSGASASDDVPGVRHVRETELAAVAFSSLLLSNDDDGVGKTVFKMPDLPFDTRDPAVRDFLTLTRSGARLIVSKLPS